ncbi:RNA pseudouridine synthase superfamily protein [Toxoplasma gondii MAS]|uniref:RNA pseudouridine synthase superfamily protein n=1 Tax=Toxoplasma gondii MAS TaxID=943118 RepID=A0A086QE95_TOXGO|nr:RNA pseudouridine synthase superfamily protein [Toxoplasma gondii MAS]
MQRIVSQKVERVLRESRSSLVPCRFAPGVCTPEPWLAGDPCWNVEARAFSSKIQCLDSCVGRPARRSLFSRSRKSSCLPSSFLRLRLSPRSSLFPRFASLQSVREARPFPGSRRKSPDCRRSPLVASSVQSTNEGEEAAREKDRDTPAAAASRRPDERSEDGAEQNVDARLQAEKEVLEEIAASRRLCCKCVEAGQAGLRVDAFARLHIVGSWPAAAHLLKKKELFVVPRNASFAEHVKLLRKQRDRPRVSKDARVNAGDFVYFPRGADSLLHAKEISRPSAGLDLRERLLFKDTDFLAVDKPFGLPTRVRRSHDPRASSQRDTTGSSVYSLLHQLRFSMDETPKLLHRLGKEVTGVLLLGRTKQTAQVAVDRLRGGTFGVLTFFALLHGRPPGGRREGVIRIPLAENEAGVMVPTAVQRGGSVSVTRWKLLKVASPQTRDVKGDAEQSHACGFSLVELEIRHQQCRHQARAHCLYGLSCPIVGDRVYGPLTSRWRQLASTGAASFTSEDRVSAAAGTARLSVRNDAGDASAHAATDEETRSRVAAKSEEKRRLAEARATLGVTAPSMLHLHSRAISFETFAGRPVRIQAPLPPHMRQAASRLGWEFFVEQLDANLSPLTADMGIDEETDTEATRHSTAGPLHARGWHARKTQVDRHRGNAGQDSSVWDALGAPDARLQTRSGERGEEFEEGDTEEESEEDAWKELGDSDDEWCSPDSESVVSSEGRTIKREAFVEKQEKNWVARFLEERAQKGERNCRAAARRPAPLPPVVTKLHR